MKTILSSADIGIIGGADGPTAVMVASAGLWWLLPFAVLLVLTLAYCLMRRAAGKKAHSTTSLPEGYREIYSVDLQKNKKMALWVNGIGVLIMVILFCWMTICSCIYVYGICIILLFCVYILKILIYPNGKSMIT